MTDNINDKPSLTEIIQRFSEVNNLTLEEAENLVNADTEEEVLKNIEKYTLQKIKESMMPMNRQQRRAQEKRNKQAKKKGAISKTEAEVIAELTKKFNYINLIQKLRKLNEKEENNNEN